MERRTRPVRALVRVLAAPGFLLLLWLAQLAFAKLLAGPTRAAAKLGMRGSTWFVDGHRLRALVELLISEPGIMGTIVAALGASALMAGLFSIFAAPAMLTRLSGERGLGEVLAPVGRAFPAMLVQTGYGLVFRAVCTGLAAIPTMLGAGGLPLALLIGTFPILVLDRARAAVVLDGDRPYHPMTFLRAIVHVGKRPLWWLIGTIIELLKLSVGVLALLLVIRGEFMGGSVWIARLAGLLALALGLWRLALAVDEHRGARAMSDQA